MDVYLMFLSLKNTVMSDKKINGYIYLFFINYLTMTSFQNKIWKNIILEIIDF